MAHVNGTSADEAQAEIELAWRRWFRLGVIQRWTIEVSESLRRAYSALAAIHGLVVDGSAEVDT